MFSNQRLSLATVFAVLALAGCKKEEEPAPTLPQATQTGQNTAGAKVNGTVWRPVQQSLFGGPAIQAFYGKRSTGQQLRILLTYSPDKEDEPLSQTSLLLYVPDIRTAGPVSLDQYADPRLTTSNPAYGLFSYEKPSPDEQFITGPTAPGQLTITRLDTVARIVAGTFEFQAKPLTGTGSVSVTEGRFDLKY